MSSSPPRGRQALLAKFRALTYERLERLTGAVLELERDPSAADTGGVLMREVHTLKGEARLMGFVEVNTVAHRTEDVLIRVRERGFRFEEGEVDLVLRAFDLINGLLGETAAEIQGELPTFISAVDAMLAGEPGAADAARTREEAAPAHVPASAEPADESTTTPASSEARPEAAAKEAVSASSETRPEAALKGTEDDSAGTRRRRRRERPSGEIPVETALRVEVDQVEHLTRFVGDLLQNQGDTCRSIASLVDLSSRWRRAIEELRNRLRPHLLPHADKGAGLSESTSAALKELLNELQDLGTRAARISAAAQDSSRASGESLEQLEQTVRDLRLVPLQALFVRYPRAVRDLAKEQGKTVRLTLAGEELRLDKYVIDRIGEPLLHLIRNAIDHGIELPDERRAAGKPTEASLVLSARQVGPRVEVMVTDDGRGLSEERIRQAALARGELTAAEMDELTSDQVLQLVFRPGVSTREQATEISGRGIGLDAVRTSVEALGGAVRVESEPGVSTRFVASVPVFAALSRALLIELAPLRVAIPSAAVVAITDLATGSIVKAGEGFALSYEEQLIPLRDLADLLGVARPTDDLPATDRIVIVEGEGRRLGLFVAETTGEEEVLQRPVGRFLEGARMLIGTTVLQSGPPAVLINPGELVRRAGLMKERRRFRREVEVARQVLLVDDSELFREMLAGVVRELGHAVIEASNGQQALERMRQRRPDLVITDLEMPLMDGFELIQSVRVLPELRDVPVIVLSGLGSEADKQRAAQLGAEAYLVKADFSDKMLRDTIRRYVRGARPKPGSDDTETTTTKRTN
jgi:two-component system chemotaxis sensor kinase CheA